MARSHAEQTIRLFLLVEAATFILAALVHAGILLTGYEHFAARTAESVIAAVLLVGLVVSWIHPAWTRVSGIVAQAFALLGTCVGLLTIAIGVGPQSGADLVYHVAIILVLVWGLVVAIRQPHGAAA